MKKAIYFAVLSLFILSLFTLPGCCGCLPQKEAQPLHSFPEDNAPSQVIKTDTRWIMLNSTYGGRDYTVSVSEDLETFHSVYSVQDVSIWYFEANDKAVVWCEKSADFYSFKVYTFSSQKTATLFQVPVDTGYQPQNVGIFLDYVFFSVIDYQQEQVRVLAYDVELQTTTEAYVLEFQEEKQPYSIHLEDGFLSLACSDHIKVINLQTRKPVFESEISDNVSHIFCASYDSKQDTCVLYYADLESENIGVLKEGADSIDAVYTFAENHYAYQDKLECYDGHIYWIAQANVTGNVSNHYKLVDYNYLEHKSVETERCFDFSRFADTVYFLRFNKPGEYTHIDLCQQP